MIKLRPYQNDLINSIRDKFRENKKRIILCSPTGSGKTIMFSYMVKEHLNRGGRVLIFTHRKELLQQTGGAFKGFGLEAENIESENKPDLTKSLHVSMIETFYRRIERYELFLRSRTMIIVDECHINSFTKVLDNVSNGPFVIGATATPYRKGNKVPELSEFYEDIVQNVSISDLIERGFLSKPKTMGVKIDMSSMKKKGDDYDTKEYYQETKMWTGVLNNWERLCKNTKTILFASNVQSSKDVCQEFVDRGYDAKHLDGNTPKLERKRILDWFDKSKNGIICNCGILTTGFDQPDIETVILYRATTSLPLFLQMVGRGSRIYSGKDHFNILDFGNNVSRLGFWEADRTWKLTADKKRSSKKGVQPIKDCPNCEAMLPANAQKCEYCGYEFKKTEKEKKEAYLEELTYNQIKSKIGEMSIPEMEELRVAKDYKLGWLLHNLENVGQLIEYAELKGYKSGWINRTAKRLEMI